MKSFNVPPSDTHPLALSPPLMTNFLTYLLINIFVFIKKKWFLFGVFNLDVR